MAIRLTWTVNSDHAREPRHAVTSSMHLGLFVERMDNAMRRINHYPLDSVVCYFNTCLIHWIAIYSLDSGIHPLNNWALSSL